MDALIKEGYISYSGKKPKIGHSSIDLSLANEAYQMLNGSVKPFRTASTNSYLQLIEMDGLAKKLSRPEDGIYELEQRTTYVFKLQEKLEAGLRNSKAIYGQATAKSTVGRVDVLARLIVDGMQTYESFDPYGLENASGEMFLEITPITFKVKVRAGESLSQLRFFYGKPDDAVIKEEKLFRTVFFDPEHRDGALRVSLTDAIIGNPVKRYPCKGVAFRSKKLEKTHAAVPLMKDATRPDPCDYWDVEMADGSKRLLIEPDRFYILRSKEKLHVPKGVAIYCRASDETMGEMRIHYAGFVHPFFGLYREDGTKGTPLIFEVRGHQVPVSLGDQEKMANLIFYRMSLDPPELTHEEEEEEKKGYSSQDLKLSKFFADWPENIKRNGDGSVEAEKK